jgi:hypothetical protein
MKPSVTKFVMALGLVLIGVAIGVGGVYFADADDSPGAGVLALLLMTGLVVFGVRTALRAKHSADVRQH